MRLLFLLEQHMATAEQSEQRSLWNVFLSVFVSLRAPHSGFLGFHVDVIFQLPCCFSPSSSNSSGLFSTVHHCWHLLDCSDKNTHFTLQFKIWRHLLQELPIFGFFFQCNAMHGSLCGLETREFARSPVAHAVWFRWELWLRHFFLHQVRPIRCRNKYPAHGEQFSLIRTIYHQSSSARWRYDFHHMKWFVLNTCSVSQ